MLADQTANHKSDVQADSAQMGSVNAEYVKHLLSLESDELFCEALPNYVASPHLSLHATCDVLDDPRVLARLCAVSDRLVTLTILTLAKPDYVGLDILFDERLLPRYAQIRRGHLRGTFLPYARQLVGFQEREWLHVLRTYQQAPGVHARQGKPIVISMEDVMMQPIRWLWWPYIALGKLTMLDGDPGIGKSLLMTRLAANLSRGIPLPDQEGMPTLGVGEGHITLMLSTEDGLEDTLKPRLEEAGADCSKVKVLTGWQDIQGETHPFTFADMPILRTALEELRPRLVIIDPIQAYLGGKLDMHRANETRPMLEALRRLAEEFECAIVCIRHPAKSSANSKAIHRGLGSIDFIGAARTGLFIEQHPTEPTKVLLAQSKSNIGPLGRTQVFTKECGEFEWVGVSRLSAELLAGSGRGPDPYAFLEAACWLETRLSDGAKVSMQTLWEEAQEEGLTLPTLRRAKKALGVRSVRDGEEWFWQLPPMRTVQKPNPFYSLSHDGVLENVVQNQEVPLMFEEPGSQLDFAPVCRPDCADCEACSEPYLQGDGAEEHERGLATEPVEISEDSQEIPQQTTVQGPPLFCKKCHRRATWRDRGTHYACHACDARVPKERR